MIDRIFNARQSRRAHPSGKFDNAKRWYPSEDEECDCCGHIRSPSRSYPFSLMVHCRTKTHIKKLVETYGIDSEDLLSEANMGELPKPAKLRRACADNIAYKKMAVGDDGRLYSIFDASQWLLGVERKETPHQDHNGGFYVYKDIYDAIDAPFPDNSELGSGAKVVVKVKVGGRYCRYDNDKLAFERVTPINVEEILPTKQRWV